MIARVIEFSARFRFLVIALVLSCAVYGWWSMTHVVLDAIPDLSETQVIIYSRWDRSPDVIEDQVTYPIVTALLGAPKVKAVRGFSDFGYSFVYVIYEESTDIYWARTRTLEYLSRASQQLPSGVKTELGPDATGLGWVYQYALVDKSGKQNPAQLRSLQDWYLRYHLASVPGVAEVAPVGGFGKQYQVNVDPNKLLAFNVSINKVIEAVRGSNSESGGRMIEVGGAEYMVRGRGYTKSVEDLENVVVASSPEGASVRVRDVGQVVIGPDLRRGAFDLDGDGETVSGIVIMRQGENALDVIGRVKEKLRQIQSGLPAGVSIVPVYDRSEVIRNSISTLRSTVIEVVIVVSLVILLFLWHIPSALIPIITIPVTLLISFIPFHELGISANILSLGGLAIAIGAMVDASIVLVEQVHKKLEGWQRAGSSGDYKEAIIVALKEVGGPGFFALLVIAVSFIPVLALESQEGKLFRPLAWSKSLAMLVAAVLAITLDPALRLLFTRMSRFNFQPAWLCRFANAVLVGRIHAEEANPVSRYLIRWYEPVCRWALGAKWKVLAAVCFLFAATVPAFISLGSEFMPPLYEETLFFMPSTAPGISIGEAQRMLQVTDRVLKQFPEVARVGGKAGRAETATDPAPLSMLETVISLKPRKQWRHIDTWYSSWSPEWLKPLFRIVSHDTISPEQLVALMNHALQVPGLSNAWTMPIRGRIDMISTGIRTPVGIKIQGDNLETIQELGKQVEMLLRPLKGTRTVFAERSAEGFFLDFDWNREALGRYGLTIADAQVAVQNAIGGENVTTTVEGRARYPVNVRYMRDFRSDVNALRSVLVSAGDGRQIPLSEIAEIKTSSGPGMIRDEGGLLTGYVYIDLEGRDPGGYVAEAKSLLDAKMKLPPGFSLVWSGSFEAIERMNRRMQLIVPVTIALILILLLLNTRSVVGTVIVSLAVPLSAIGAVWLLYFLGYNMSIGVWVGIIALMGLDASNGVFMLLYLDLACDAARTAGVLSSPAQLRAAILQGAVKRIRPKVMTVGAAFLGLVPLLWATGTGSDVMKRIAAPIVGGVLTSFLLELVVYPVVYELWKLRSLRQEQVLAHALTEVAVETWVP